MRASFAAACSLASSSKCLSRIGSSGRGAGTAIMAVDYTGSGHETRRQYLVRTVAPQVDAVEQPVQLIDRQLDGLVAGIGLGLEAFGFQTLEPQAEAIALPVEDLDLTAGAVEEHEQHGVEHFHLDVQLDQSGQAVDGFAEIDGFWVEVDLLHLGVGTHHGMNSGENGSSASNDLRAMGRWGLWSGYEESEVSNVSSAGTLEISNPSSDNPGQTFLNWVKEGILSHKLIINDSKAKIHTVSGTVFLVTPGLFQRYVQEFPGIAKRVDQEIEEWRWVQKQFENLKVHRKRDNGLNIWACQVQGPRKRTTLKGYVIEEPKLFFELTPPDNPFLKIDDIASTGH